MANVFTPVTSNGQLANAEADVYTPSGAKVAENVRLTVTNTSTTNAEVVSVFYQPSGGTSRLVRKFALQAGSSTTGAESDDEFFPCMANGDKIRGFATDATTVNWLIQAMERDA